MKQALPDQIVDGAAWLEGGVQLQEGLGPEPLALEDVVDKLPDPWIADLDEAASVVPVVGDEAVLQLEYVHLTAPPAEEGAVQQQGALGAKDAWSADLQVYLSTTGCGYSPSHL